MCPTSSRHASKLTSADCMAGGGVAAVKLPISETPTVPVLNPSEWAPITLRSIPPAPPLVDRAEAVDKKVVADVVPAVRLHVVDLDPAHDRRRLPRGVRVGPGRVVDDGELQRRGIARLRARDLLVRGP